MAAPRVLAVLPAFIPSTVISVVKPFVRLHRQGRIEARVTLELFTRRTDLAWAEVGVFCRNHEPRFAHLRDALLARGTPYVYDLDDNLFEIPLDSEEGSYHRDPARLEELARYLRRASLVRVYSEELRSRVAELNPRVLTVTASVDWSLVPDEPPARDPTRVRVVYVTSRLKDDLARLFLPDLVRLRERFGERVEIVFWGATGAGRGMPGIRRLAPVPDYDAFLSRLARSGFDVGLAPLPDDPFHRSKTNNKYREYGACRIAGVYSDVSVYSSCVRHGETGLLVAPHEGAWLDAVSRLVQDAALRERIQSRAHEDVRANYSQERSEGEWLDQIRRVLDEAGCAGPPGASAAVPRSPGESWFLQHTASRAGRAVSRLRRTGVRATLAGFCWYLHGLRTMLRLRRELRTPSGRAADKPRAQHRRPRS